MAHVVVEWTDNLEADGFVLRPLLAAIAGSMREADGVFPVGGIRVRGVRLTDYVIADDAGGDAFINIVVRMGEGRPAAWRKTYFDALFEVIKAHLGDLPERRPLALSLYVDEAREGASWKHNSIHARLAKDYDAARP